MMLACGSFSDPVERALQLALHADELPPHLRGAMQAAVFPGGARLRPRLCMAVAAACGAPQHPAALKAAVAVELLHCASLVHDDLPCFDDADSRRGRPALHCQFGEALAVLAGDGLIVRAFAVAAGMAVTQPASGSAFVMELAQAATSLVAGQGWESEPTPDLKAYHHGKTAALFEAATVGGALAAGAEAAEWRPLGRSLGQAYQLADDLADLEEDVPALNVARLHGRAGTRERLQQVLHTARQTAPAQAEALDAWFVGLHRQLGDLLPMV